MLKKILIINSLANSNQPLTVLLEGLSQKGYSFSLLTTERKKDSPLAKLFSEQGWPNKKIHLGPSGNKKNFIAASLFLPWLVWFFFFYLIKLAFYKYNKKIEAVICLGENEKIVATPAAGLLNLPLFWLEYPGTDYRRNNKLWLWFYKKFSPWAKIISFTNAGKIELEKLGIKTANLRVIQPGIKLKQSAYQENIFSKLALADQPQFKKKFFTLGTVMELKQTPKIETLLQAIKKCLAIIPNLQLIIIGEGEEKKDLIWLTKKMEIDNLVWFVGAQGHLKKWLDGLDLFIVTAERPKIADFIVVLQAMASGLPVIASRDSGFDDIIFDDKTGILLASDDSESLSGQIIKFSQDKLYRRQLGQAARERVEKYFTAAKMLEQFEKILNQ